MSWVPARIRYMAIGGGLEKVSLVQVRRAGWSGRRGYMATRLMNTFGRCRHDRGVVGMQAIMQIRG